MTRRGRGGDAARVPGRAGLHVQGGERLHLHRNAVSYRVRWITELLGVDLDDPDLRLALQIACRARLLR